jgi:uncharacterized membrane protein (DUF485 family)
MPKSAQEIIVSNEFRQLVKKRWSVSIVLLILLFVIYYGYILLIAYAKPFLAIKIGEYTTLGIPIGVAVIVLAWLLTVGYVYWANASYDPDVQKLKDQM